MGVYWVIMNRQWNTLIEKELFANYWNYNIARTAEAVILLDMIQTINNKVYQITNAELPVAMDNKAVWEIKYGSMPVPNHYN